MDFGNEVQQRGKRVFRPKDQFSLGWPSDNTSSEQEYEQVVPIEKYYEKPTKNQVSNNFVEKTYVAKTKKSENFGKITNQPYQQVAPPSIIRPQENQFQFS